MLRFFVYLIIILIIAFIPFKSYTRENKIVEISKNSAIHVSLSEIQTPKVKSKKIIKEIHPKQKKIIKKIVQKKEPTKPVIQKVQKKIEPTKIQEEAKNEQIVAQVSNTSVQKSRAQTIKERYYSLVYEEIDAQKRYPKKALHFRQEGDVVVSFLVLDDGSISRFKIIQKSDFEILNKEIERIFKKLRKFDKPPSEIETPLEIQIMIRFKIDKE